MYRIMQTTLKQKQIDIHDMVGIIPDTGDSVREVREIRKKLSKEIKSVDDLLALNKLIE